MTKLRTIVFRLKSYINYWLECTDAHSLHSPFIYGFYNQVIQDKNSNNPLFDGIENLRKQLLKDERIIEITDMGAGSSVNPNSKRTIKDIAKNSISDARSSRFFYRIIDYFNAKNILEFGTSLGINTLFLALNPSINKVISIEGCKATSDVALANFQGLIGDKIIVINSEICKSFSDISFEVNKLDFVLFDANHTYEATMQYYQNCKQFFHEDTVLVFDDIYWSQGMANAWNEIIQDVTVTTSIDVFEMGIVFLKKSLQKEHYVLKW